MSMAKVNEMQVDGTNDILNLKTRAASDTQQEAKGPLLVSADPQYFKGENRLSKGRNEQCFVAKEVEIASDMAAYVTVTERDVRDTKSKTALKEAVVRRTQRGQESYGIPPNELRLVIIGKSGSGKSSIANTIIGKDICKTGASATAITKETEKYRASRFGKEIVLVDTPGFFDPEIEIKETIEEISKCTVMTSPGFHAFLLVVRIGRFTAEEINTFKEFEKLFGEKLYDFMIIVFTQMDDLDRDKKTLDEYVRNRIPSNLKEIIERCNRRYVGFNNVGNKKIRKKTTKKVLGIIETMIDSKDPNHYTNDAFKQAEKDLCETIEAETERMQAAKKADFDEMFAEKEKKMREEHAIKMKEIEEVYVKLMADQKKKADFDEMVAEKEKKMREEHAIKMKEIKDVYVKLMADQKKSCLDLNKRLDYDRKLRQKKIHEENELNQARITEEMKRMEDKLIQQIQKEARKEAKRGKSPCVIM